MKKYFEKIDFVRDSLEKNPKNWGLFQDEMNDVFDSIAKDLVSLQDMAGRESVARFQKIFVSKFRSYLLFGDCVKWCFEKPYGYSGDFKIIDSIYKAEPQNLGFERICDNYFLRMGPSISTRNRKEDFKNLIREFLLGSENKNPSSLSLMSLACGPCRDIKELYDESEPLLSKLNIDCYDFEKDAIAYASELLKNQKNVQFFQEDIFGIFLSRSLEKKINKKYDFVLCTGLFDYLKEKTAVRLISNLRSILKHKGVLCISNYTEKENNPWAFLMEWVVEWRLIYRSEQEFKQLFYAAGFRPEELKIKREELNIMQYALVEKIY